jgi:hypothetical protein
MICFNNLRICSRRRWACRRCVTVCTKYNTCQARRRWRSSHIAMPIIRSWNWRSSVPTCSDIMPSTSVFFAPMFFAPMLLVKKGDGSWRFCVDFCALNAVTVKDKFPIPMVELLDKLRGATVSKLDFQFNYH